ncbi:MAG: DUF4369 domain-containing protein, partial [Bacteroidia bacterium]
MKRIFYLIVIAAIVTACSNEPKFIVTGTIDGADSGMVLLQKRIPGGYSVIDSANIDNGTFKIEGAIDYPQMVMLSLKDKRGGINFFIENSEITISGNADSLYLASVIGSATQAEFETYKASLDGFNAEMRTAFDRYREARTAGDEELTASIEKELEALENKQLELKKEFIANNPASYVTPVVLNEISYYLEAPEMET